MGAPGGVVEEAVETGGVAAAVARAAARLRESTVAVRSRGGGGAGVAWDEATVVTNAHVARDRRLTIETHDGRELRAAVVRRDPARDLAALRVEGGGLVPAPLGDARALRPGDVVLAVGNPLGVPGALAMGIVHTLAARPERLGPGGHRWVQADVRLAPGNSGGPLADAHARVVGINSMIVGGLGLAVPTDAVERFLGRVAAPAPLGVTVRPALVRQRGAADRLGLAVVRVGDGGAAARAGLIVGDVLVGVDGRPFGAPHDLAALVAEGEVGSVVALDLVRGGRLEQRVLTLAAAAAGARAA